MQGAADVTDDGKLVFELRKTDPRSVALEADGARVARLNRDLLILIRGLTTWEATATLLDSHRSEISYVTISHLCARLPQIIALDGPRDGGVEGRHAGGPTDGPLIGRHAADHLLVSLAELVLHHALSFQPQHFAQCATGLSACGHSDPAFWKALARASSRRMASFHPPQLAALSAAIAIAGFVPSLAWVQQCEKQAIRYLHACSPEAQAALLWSWGAFSHTPSKRLLDGIKMRLREQMRRHELGPDLLLQVRWGEEGGIWLGLLPM